MINKLSIQYVFLILTLMFSSSCSAVGVPRTSDPYTLISFAYEMMHQYRPQKAQEFIKEAIQQFEERGDKKGLAEAYMAYGLYHKGKFYVPTEAVMDSVDHWDYSKRRLYEESIDYKKSEEYYLLAIKYFESLKSDEGLSRAYGVLATLYAVWGEKEKKLNAISESEKFYRKMKAEKPTAESTLVLKKGETFLSFLEELKSQ